MAKRTEKFTVNQTDIFHDLENSPLEQEYVDLDITLELRGAVAQALKIAERRGISRQRMVDELNALMPHLNQRKITLRKINAWMAQSKEDYPIPAYVIPAICVATQCDLPLRVMANEIGFDLSDQRERLAQELGQAELERVATSKRIRTIKNKLGV